MITIPELKTFLRIDGDEFDSELSQLIDEGKEYLKKSGVIVEEGPLYSRAISIYALLNHEQFQKDLHVEKLEKALTNLILYLK